MCILTPAIVSQGRGLRDGDGSFNFCARAALLIAEGGEKDIGFLHWKQRL